MQDGSNQGYGQSNSWSNEFNQGFQANDYRNLSYIQCIGALVKSITQIAQNPGGWGGGIKAFNIGNIQRQFSINTQYVTTTNSSGGVISGLALNFLVANVLNIILTLWSVLRYSRYYGVGTIITSVIGLAVGLAVSAAIYSLFIYLVSKNYDYWKTTALKVAMVIAIIGIIVYGLQAIGGLFGLIRFSIPSLVSELTSLGCLYAWMMISNSLSYAQPYIDGQGQPDNQAQQNQQPQGPQQSQEPQGPNYGSSTASFCPHCGNQVSPGQAFCGGCGRRIS